MPLLTQEHHDHLKKFGYVVVHDAVPIENCIALINTLWEFLKLDPNNREDWYKKPVSPGGLVEIYQHQTLWDNRQYPRIHQIFTELWGTEKLWVSIDRAALKVPSHPDHPEYHNKGFIHWDTDSKRVPPSKGLQGVLYLADTAANQGGFQCVPELYQQFDEWVKTQPEDRNAHHPDLTGFSITPISGRAGDLVIWDVMLPHGSGHNTADSPRYAQYISMSPPERITIETKEQRIDCWKNHRPPGNSIFPGDERKIEEQFGQTAQLTDLGRKLLGIDDWD